MFERYTEDARRALFFARYECSQLGGRTIAAEHLLLGLLRQPTGLVSKVFTAWNVSLPDLRHQLEARVRHGDTVSTSVEIAFSEAAKRALNLAADEANGLAHKDIECAHLLLGLLRDDDSFAAKTLIAHGLRVNTVRSYIATQAATSAATSQDSERHPAADDTMLSVATAHLQRIAGLVVELAKADRDSDESRVLVEWIHDELMMLQELWRGGRG